MKTENTSLRRAVITGGSSGIGLATAIMMLDQGYAVVSLDVNPPANDNIPYFFADVSDDRSVVKAVAQAVELLGGIDVVINSAGISSVGAVDANSDEEWTKTLNVNVIGIARVCRAALPHLRQSENAVIVNLASIASHTGLANRVLYGASKGAVMAMTLDMATDFLQDGIRVNAVAPGTADTPWVARLLAQADDPVEAKRSLAARQPIGRLVTADEVAFSICFLADPRASSTTGTILDVDGGMHHLSPPR
jgi:NAD(P)-dependent dehydrogenase (short-subunit alcohol dehydrogenase family)